MTPPQSSLTPPPLEIAPLADADLEEWLRLRIALWPEAKRSDLERERDVYTSGAGSHAAFVARRAGGGLGGFVEVSLREYAEGCETSPVGFIEGWYVDAELRGRGVGRALVRAAEAWAVAKGCTEMGSDTEGENKGSQAAHAALGYRARQMVSFWRTLR